MDNDNGYVESVPVAGDPSLMMWDEHNNSALRYSIELKPLDTLVYWGCPWWQVWKPVNLGIQVMTWSRYVHTATYFYGGPGVYRSLVTDATAGGIDVRPLSSDLLSKAKISVYRYLDTRLHVDQWDLQAFVFKHWGPHTKYAVGKLLQEGWAEIAGGANKPDPIECPNRFICSEWSSLLDRLFGKKHMPVVGEEVYVPLDPCPDIADRFTAPADYTDRTKSVLTCVEPNLRLINA